MYRIGVDIGGTKINIGLFSEDGKLISNEKIYVCETADIVAEIKRVILGICERNSVDFGKILGCGVGIPGTVSADGKRILKAPNLSALKEDFALSLEGALGVPVTLVQDSRAAAFGEYKCGGGVGFDTVVCVTLGTGVGTGIVMNGKIFAGELGCAGELGHVPVVEGGRECGCGRRGCLEKYAAGGGLDITARELLGAGKSAHDLFEASKAGNKEAKSAISSAIESLGRVMVSVVNMLSPGCILFSGGLSEQEELYLNPLISYIEEHCYKTDTLPHIKKAQLGENAPLYGAALIARAGARRASLSASVMCADILNMKTALAELEESGVEYIHCDIMDNHFVPNLMLPPELLNKMRRGTKLPFDYHIMAENPESIIERLDIREGDFVSVHYESTRHLQRAISLVKQKGGFASVALNPATPLEALGEVLDEVDMVLIMTVNPGFAGQKLVPGAISKIRRTRELLDSRGLERVLIQVDGNCSFENIPKMHEAGADMFVAGTSSIFNDKFSLNEGVRRVADSLIGR